MRVRSYIDEEKRRLLVTFRGKITLADIDEMTRTSGAAQMLNYPLLADMHQGELSFPAEDFPLFHGMVKALARRSRLGQTAVLVASEADLAVLQRLSELAAEFCKVRGFLDRAEAEHWLGWHEEGGSKPAPVVACAGA